MIQHFPNVRPGSTLYIPWSTYAGATGASITMTGLAVTDIEVYKNGSVTQRASDTGFALLDTDGTDFDGLTGIHGISIDLSSNATAGFFTAGGFYWVVISSVTIDAQTVNFVAATFTIGYASAILNTTIATLSSQTSFTLTMGPAENNALVGCNCVIHDIASPVQLGIGRITAYTGSTLTVTLGAGVTFTAAAGDNISIFPPASLSAAVIADINATVDTALADYDGPTHAELISEINTVQTDIAGLNDPTAAEIADAVWDEDIDAAHQTANTAGKRLDDASTTVATNLNTTVSSRSDFDSTTDTVSLSTATETQIDDIETNLLNHLLGFATFGTINDATPSATEFVVSADFTNSNDHYNGLKCYVLSGAQKGRRAEITDQVGLTLTLDTGFTAAPANGSIIAIMS